MTDTQGRKAGGVGDRQYNNRYKPADETGESPTLSKDRYGFDLGDIDIPCEYARDYIGYCKYSNKYDSSLPERKSRLRCAIHFLNNARETDILSAVRTDIEVYIKYCIDERCLRKGTIEMRLDSIANLIKHIHTRCNPSSRPHLTYSMVNDIEVADFGGIRPPIEREPLSREEVTQLIDAAGNKYPQCNKDVIESRNPHRDKLIVMTLYETGIRNADLRGLRLEHYDHDEKLLDIEGSKGENNGTISYRVPVRDSLARKLRHWIEVGRPAFLGDKESEYIFPSEQGGKIERNGTVSRIVKHAAERAGIDGEIGSIQNGNETKSMSRVTPHVLRHSITTHLDGDFDLEDELLKLLLGNTSTLDAYREESANKKELDQIRTTLHHLD